jgi:hypothetical protein
LAFNTPEVEAKPQLRLEILPDNEKTLKDKLQV